jgi:hypothetical protein
MGGLHIRDAWSSLQDDPRGGTGSGSKQGMQKHQCESSWIHNDHVPRHEDYAAILPGVCGHAVPLATSVTRSMRRRMIAARTGPDGKRLLMS